MENMLTDFFTKPLQGSAFQKMWDIILNLPSNNKIDGVHRSVLVERKNDRTKNDLNSMDNNSNDEGNRRKENGKRENRLKNKNFTN